MATFNPDVPERDTPDFKSYSRGAPGLAADTSTGNLLKNMAGLFEGAVTLTDNYFKSASKEEATKAVDNIRDSYLGYNKPPAGVQDSNTPDEVTRQGERLGNLHEAYKSGRVKESHYWMLLDSEARRLRSKYPGYRDVIDNQIASMVGTTPANALMRALKSEAAAAASQGQDSAKAYQRKIDELAQRGDLPPDFFERERAGKPYSMTELRIRENDRAKERADTNLRKSQLELASAEGKVIDSRVEDEARRAVRTSTDTLLRDTVGIAGQNKQQLDSILERASKGDAISAEETAKAAMMIKTLRATAVQNAQAVLDQETETGGWSFSKALPEEKRRAILKSIESDFDAMEEFIGAKNWNLVSHQANVVTALKDEDVANVYRNDPNARNLATARQIFGDQALNAAMASEPRLLASTSQSVLNIEMTRLATRNNKQGYSLDQAVTNAARAGVTPDKEPQFYNALVDRAIKVATDESTPLEARVNILDSLFGAGNQGFISRIAGPDGKVNPTIQMQYYNKLVSPQMEAAVYKLATEGRKDVWEKYRVWALNTTSAMMQTEMKTLQDTKEFRKNVDVVFNDKTLQFSIVPRENPAKQGNILVGLNEPFQERQAQASLARVNQMLANIQPIIRRFPEDPGVSTAKLMQYFGFNPNAKFDPEGTVFDNIGAKLKDWIISQSEPAIKAGALLDGREPVKKEQGRLSDTE